ncbi:MAG TPA: DUF2292 domain-containing protein [Patescibacteria group bacterium]|nr:DUF2292 domain-containing protein [Patescibacteria group bacterium]
MNNYSTKQINENLLKEVVDALKNIRGWGSVEIFVQDFKVVQITERNIRKTMSNGSSAHSKKLGA